MLLLHNVGPAAFGCSLANAFSLMGLLKWACEVQVASPVLGKLRPTPVPVPVQVPVQEACVRDALNFDPEFGVGQDGFDAMQRLVGWVDRVDPSYRT